MKKLMIGAAVAAITVGAFAGACEDPETPGTQCRAWDLKMNLKSLGPKKIKCKIAAESVCDDPTTDMVYYMDNVTRKLTGYLWICDYVCDDELEFNVVLWDAKNKKAIIAAPAGGTDYQTVAATEIYAYGKKANKVAGNLEIAGTDASGEDAIAVNATGVTGKITKGTQDDDCYIKSLSGYAAGLIAYLKPNSVVVATAATLCGEPTEEVCDEFLAKLIPFCEACCFESWCEAEDAPDMVPAAGTWSMKYNKKVSKGGKSIQALVPAYAL
jgi:hypothetical protein